MKILKIKKLTKCFGGVRALDRLSIEIEKGKITGIIGPNGSGKTTLINLLSGVLKADSGEVIIEESEKISHILPHQIFFFGITRTFQNTRLFEQMTVLDNILVIVTERSVLGSLFEKHTNYHYKIAQEILEKIGLWRKRNQLALELSYGERKLLEIARTLVIDAKIYLFDEPFAGLFPEMKKNISNIIINLKKENKSVILIEHDMNLIRELCDYVFVMDEGKLLTKGKPEEVLKKREVIEAYLGK